MTDDTHTAEWREAQAEHLYQESRRLALAATADDPDGPCCWQYDELYYYGWCVTRRSYSGTGPTAIASLLWDSADIVCCDDREAARSLATQRNTPPRLQSANPDAAPAREVGL